jgi:hypothetical protein
MAVQSVEVKAVCPKTQKEGQMSGRKRRMFRCRLCEHLNVRLWVE